MKDILEPALKGTVGTLESIKNHAPTVRRVIVLSSFAALINYISPPKVYDETSWNPVTWDAAVSNPRLTYPGSKVSRRWAQNTAVLLTCIFFCLDPGRKGCLGLHPDSESLV